MPAPTHPSSVPLDRRAQRRLETLDQILDIALATMTEKGVAGLTISAIARELKVKPPSVYKYFDSLLAVYDALFQRGQQENLDALREAIAFSARGLPAVEAGLEATGRWAVANPMLAQLLFWRPVPGYTPSPGAFAPTLEIVATLRRELGHAARAGQLAQDATSDEAMALLSTLHFGIISQQLANDPDSDWEHGRFTRLLPTVIELFIRHYPPPPGA